jgi:hypothetical protein
MRNRTYGGVGTSRMIPAPYPMCRHCGGQLIKLPASMVVCSTLVDPVTYCRIPDAASVTSTTEPDHGHA